MEVHTTYTMDRMHTFMQWSVAFLCLPATLRELR